MARLAAQIARTAPTTSRLKRKAQSLPAMLILTDPQRTPNPLALAECLPKGAGLVYRPFGAADALQTAASLVRIARRRGLTLLVGADAHLALACGADGVHLPERQMDEVQPLRARWPKALITCAAHSRRALHHAATTGADAALLSSVFPSLSPSAGRPMGPVRMAQLVRGLKLSVYALGGVDSRTARQLFGTGVAGVAAIGAGVHALTPP